MRSTVTIRKGEQWGTIGPAPDDIRVVHSDAEVRALVIAARAAGTELPPMALLGGDLMKTVGGTGDATRLQGDVPVLPIDVVRVESPGRDTTWCVAHLVARRSWWRDEIVAAMNAQHIGSWDVTPRGHPNDGRIDLVRVAASMSIRDRLQARRRLPQGTHVPHPDIEVRQVSSTTIELARATRIWIDGERWGSVTSITLTVEPDALLVVV